MAVELVDPLLALLIIFSCGATLYPPLCVCVSVCLFVPRFVYPLFRTSTKAWMTPGSDQQYSGLQKE